MSQYDWRKFKFFRKLVYKYRKKLKPAKIRLPGGIWVYAGDTLPPEVRKGLYAEHYEATELQFASALLRPGDRVLEVGSGIGVVAMACARICGAENVTCYEANPEAVKQLRRNFALNGMTPRTRQKAVATHVGMADFYVNDNIVSSSLVDRKFGGLTQVPCEDFAKVVQELDPTVIVMDVEGAEIDLLPHADLAGVDRIIVELHAKIVGEAAIVQLTETLQARGFAQRHDYTKHNVACFERICFKAV